MQIRKNENNKIYCIDGLKGIGACLIAFVWHYQHFAPQAGSPFYRLFSLFYDRGDRVVELFFLLSGLGIALGYQKKILEGKISFNKFMFKRVEKLFPLMWLTLLITTVLQFVHIALNGATFVYPYFDLYHFVLNVFGLQNTFIGMQWSFNSPSWCISILLVCYVLYYMVVNGSRGKEEGYLWLKYVGISLLGVMIYISRLDFTIINPIIGRGLSCFFLGVLIAGIYEQRERLFTQRIGYLCLVFLIACWLLIRRFGYQVSGDFDLLVILGLVPAVVICVLFIPWLNKFFSLAPFVYLGKISFGIYLWHFPVQCVWRIAELLLGVSVNYSSRVIWLLYALSVLVVATLYDELVQNGVNKVWTLFLRGDTGEKNGE